MSLQIRWDNEQKSVVRLKLEEDWTWKELYERNEEIVEMMSSVTHTVHLLLDYTSNPPLPTNGVITHARNIFSAYPANCDLRVVVSTSMLVLRLVSAFQMTFKANLGKQVLAAKSSEDAYRMFNKRERKKDRQLIS